MQTQNYTITQIYESPLVINRLLEPIPFNPATIQRGWGWWGEGEGLKKGKENITGKKNINYT